MSENSDIKYLVDRIKALEDKVARREDYVKATVGTVYRMVHPVHRPILTIEEWKNVSLGNNPDGTVPVDQGPDCLAQCKTSLEVALNNAVSFGDRVAAGNAYDLCIASCGVIPPSLQNVWR